MMRTSHPSSPTRPLHLVFARGYHVAVAIALALIVSMWWNGNQQLDQLADDTDVARRTEHFATDLRRLSGTLSLVVNEPLSLSLRSDVERQTEHAEADWDALADDLGTANPTPDVGPELAGVRGLGPSIDAVLADARMIGEQGDLGVGGLSVDDAVGASNLAIQANDVAERLQLVVQVLEADADASVEGMREANLLASAAGLAVLLVLVIFLLRPLREKLRVESEALSHAHATHREEAARQELTAHLADGLEAVENETETLRVVERSFDRLVTSHPVELLLTDGRGDLTRVVEHPDLGGPGCGVDSPWSCPAIRRGRSIVYEDSGAINACAHLQDRADGGCSAACVPLAFMGQSLGVVHATGEAGSPPDAVFVETLGLVATQTAVRIGTLRSFAEAEKQAASDPLTGLRNRRSTEAHLQQLLEAEAPAAVAMADLDHFMTLNDTFGHDAGDRALQLFADAVRSALRDDDWIGRWGGEEFVIILRDQSATRAKETLDRVRASLADLCGRADVPTVTVSMGVVDTDAAHTAADLVHLADVALSVAKRSGRDRVIVGPVPTGPDRNDSKTVGAEGV